MMPFFPVPYDDEILYSVLARYHLRSGNTSFKATLEDVFGINSITSVMDLPSNLNRIIENLPIKSKYTADYFIYNHTLFPFYSAFIPEERAAKIISSMKGDTGGSIYSRIGIMASSITFNQYFRFCPECSKEDKKKYGELYWHRVHQVPGVLVCPQHKIFLQDSSIKIRRYNKSEYVAADEENCSDKGCSIKCSEKTFMKLLLLAQDVQALMNHIYVRKEISWFKEQYIAAMMGKGYATINGKINQKEFTKDFIDFYGEEFLKLVQSDIDLDSDINWLSDMLRKKNKVNHPIRHLLMIRFLNIPMNDLFNRKIEYKPFGNGPWPCLNAAADHYMKPVIDNIKVTYSTDCKSPVGIFKCSCGFTYLRSGPYKSEMDRYKASRILKFGPVWEARLKDLINKKLSLRMIARDLKVDPNTVNKYAIKLGLNTPWKKSESESNNIKIMGKKDKILNEEDKEELMKSYMEKWISLMHKYPDKGKNELRKTDKGLYMWLYKNDKDWLNKNSPCKKPVIAVNTRVDWGKRDKEMLQKVRIVVNAILNSPGKPERISIGFVGSKLGMRGLLERHLNKLPQTMKYLNAVKETDDDYRIRRIKWAINELGKEGQDLKEWKIFRKAGIRKEYQANLEHEVMQLIQNISYSYNSIGV
jgi:hypothetical protein